MGNHLEMDENYKLLLFQVFPVFITKMCYTYGNDANHDWRTHADSLVIL